MVMTTLTHSTIRRSLVLSSAPTNSRTMDTYNNTCGVQPPSVSTGRTNGCEVINTHTCCTISRTTLKCSGCKCWPRSNTLKTSTSNLKVRWSFSFLSSIYLYILDGQVYFVRANSIGSDFGFPRLGIKKRYKWKKMNFTTDLPKRNPLVSYIVASAVRCEKFFPPGNKGGPVYRMHAVILKVKPG